MNVDLIPIFSLPRTSLLREHLVVLDGRPVGTLRRRKIWSKDADGVPRSIVCWDWHHPSGAQGPQMGSAAFLDPEGAVQDLISHHQEATMIPCPYRPLCDYKATDENDLDEHLTSMPTEAPEHAMFPKRTRGVFVRQTTST